MQLEYYSFNAQHNLKSNTIFSNMLGRLLRIAFIFTFYQ